MIPHSLARLARMDAAEIGWRATTAARTFVDRARTRLIAPRWTRGALLPALAPHGELTAVRSALSARRWDDAHRELSRHFAGAPLRFAINPRSRPAMVERIRREFPDAARRAASRADRILAGEYDLLGYRALRFEAHPPAPSDHADLSNLTDPADLFDLPDWHLDPVHHRRAPRAFWSSVPYLDPSCGDHKIIWELNRHQHWLTLGRACWLTGDRTYRDRCIAELGSWLDANPPLVGVNWASMLELALRSLSWVWAINLFAEAPAETGHSPSQTESGPHREHIDDSTPWLVDILVALDRQLTHVEHNLSHYFSPNTHLLGEALALYVSGRALPELAASARRARIGRSILLREIERQISADGGHCERSTHYHRYALDFYSLALIVARNTGDQALTRFDDAVTRLGRAARLLADVGGCLPHIGDDDGGTLTPITGRAPDDLRDSLAIAAALVNRPELQIDDTPEEALWMLGPESAISHQPPVISGITSGALRDTGYYVSRSAASDHLVIDGGPHGYRNGGHAHADALSLTFALRGVPLLIDPGTACYTTDAAIRDRMRSTALHNTLTLDDRSQSLPNGPFHWSHVACARVHAWRTNERFDYFDGSHDGYGPIEHRRRVFALHGDLIVVADFVGGSGTHTAAVHWHLDPRWRVETRVRAATFVLDGQHGGRVGFAVPQGAIEAFTGDDAAGLGWCSPTYGRIDRTTTLRVSHAGTAPFWIVSVFDLDADNPVADVDWVPVWAEAGALGHATAIRIARALSVDHVLFAEPAADKMQTAEHAERAEKPFGSAIPASSAIKDVGTWRVGDVETDARMLFYRSTVDQPMTRLALVDGSLARAAGRRGFDVALPRTAPDFFTDVGTNDRRPRTNDTCVALPVS